MLHIITQIGKIVAADPELDPLAFLVPDQGTFRYLVGMNCDTDRRKISFSILKEAAAKEDQLSRETLQEFAFTGAEKGNRPQFSPTVPNLAYLVSQVLPNLADFLPGGELKSRLQQITEAFFEEAASGKGQKAVPVLAPETLPFDLPEPYPREADAKRKIKLMVSHIENHLKTELGVKLKETLYTVQLDGQVLAQDGEYRSFLIHKNLESPFEDTKQAICSLCGRETEVTQDTTRFLFKFYMTDKLSFASNFEEANFYKAVSLCRDCYRRWLLAERWIDGNLRTRLGGFNLYLLPEMTWPAGEEKRLLNRLKELPREFDEISNLQILLERQKRVESRLEREQPIPFIWNFLFYRKAQSAFKVLLLIREVPPSRIRRIYRTLMAVEDVRARFFPEWTQFDLNQVYSLIPLHRSGGDLREYRKILQLYHDIFTATPVRSAPLYRSFVDLARIHHFESYPQYQIGWQRDSQWALARDTVRWNLFLLFLRYENLLGGEHMMETAQLPGSVPQELEQLFDTLGYSSPQRGLALLGYVIGVIANAQWKEGLENKPVLNKISYQGMSDEKTVRLFGEIFGKLRQYQKRVGFAEPWLATAMGLYQAGGGGKAMTSDERLFYLLSGYAFQVSLAAKQGAAPVESENLTEEAEG